MKLKLFKKYFLTTAFIVIFSLGIMIMLLAFSFNSYLTSTTYETLRKNTTEVEAFMLGAVEEKHDFKTFTDGLGVITSVTDSDVFFADANGKILICGCAEWIQDRKCFHSDSLISKEDLEAEDTGKLKFGTLGIYKNPHSIVSKPVYNTAGDRLGTVFSTKPISAIREWMNSITRLYFFSAIIPLIIMFFAIYAMTYKLTKPLKLMAQASRAMAKGDFSKRIPVTSDDEIGELAVSFNQMTNSLVQLEQMRKSFVANVSHELKTPMTTISGFIDGILDGTIEPEKQEYYLSIVSSEVKRLSRLVQSMLDISKLESGEFVLKPELFDFGELLCKIVISQEQRIESRKINIVGLDEIQSVSINADEDLIHQVVYNLVDNAIKFTEPDGTIDFKVHTDNKKLNFTISNTGKGIPENELPQVFERFYKVDKSRSANKYGTGLGLYIVKTIVKAHGGTITVTSNEKSFTAFSVTLPL